MSSESPQVLHFGLFVDCESTQRSIQNPELGRRADEGAAQLLEENGFRGTFHLLPGDAQANADLYRDLKNRGHEIGLHVHPAEQGYGEFFGVYGPEEQRAILIEARQRVEQALGFAAGSLCIGYASINDFSYGLFEELGFKHGMTCIPTRLLPECASVHGGAPLGMRYGHRFHRAMEGDVDYVEVPVTVDPESRMWGGKHPQDLRVELVDARNHYYTIRKAIERQIREKTAVKYILGITHNVFEYGNKDDFRRQTLAGILGHVKRLGEEFGLKVEGATIGGLAGMYRQKVNRVGKGELKLDRRGYAEKNSMEKK